MMASTIFPQRPFPIRLFGRLLSYWQAMSAKIEALSKQSSAHRSLTSQQIKFISIGVLGIVSALFFCNAWVSDDAYITFRSVEQLFAGHGPRWNPHERVQSFSHPLWFWFLALLRIGTTNLFLAAILGSYVFFTLTLLASKRFLLHPSHWVAAVMLFSASRAFFDFTTSGLENPLSYFLLVLYLEFTFKLLTSSDENGPSAGTLLRLVLVVSLLLLCRHDLITLVGPSLLIVVWRHQTLFRKHLAWLGLLGTSPFWVWTLFSLFYYGFPVPNPAYAKLFTGIPFSVSLLQGCHYLMDSVQGDFVSLPVIAGALLLGFGSKTWFGGGIAAGLICNLTYILKVGGDFMHGRFVACATLVAILLCCRLIASPKVIMVVMTVGLGLSLGTPLSPLKTNTFHPPFFLLSYGIADERGYYLPQQSFLVYCFTDPGQHFPLSMQTEKGLWFRQSTSSVVLEAHQIGVFGYWAGTDKIIIDELALTDPLLAQLPMGYPSRIGHFRRKIPEGYVLSLKTASNQIKDPQIREFYAKIRLITQGNLCSSERFRAILEMNLGMIPRPG
ncbi:MAG: hypothetical protein K1Y36_06165 [Blastocatellia bacterium]|nr:hypothetical protein [Blastocatellia bacterium]